MECTPFYLKMLFITHFYVSNSQTNTKNTTKGNPRSYLRYATYEQFSKVHSILDPFQLQDFLMAYLLESIIDFFDGALFELGFYCFDISL